MLYRSKSRLRNDFYNFAGIGRVECCRQLLDDFSKKTESMKNLATAMIYKTMQMTAFLCVATSASAQLAPTVIIDINHKGSAALSQLKARNGVVWAVEFGSELLLGVQPDSLTAIASLDGARLGPGFASPDELLTLGHLCGDFQTHRIWATVGGYDLIRQPTSLSSIHVLRDANLAKLPNNRIVARARSNEAFVPDLQPASADIARLVTRVDADRWFQTMSDLSAFNRNSYSTGLFSARDWIRQHFVAQGLTPSDFNYQLANITSCTPTPAPITLPNIIGLKAGGILANEWIVVGAHYDSRNPSRCDGTLNPQPGANDNASGCAGVIELARVFAETQTDRSILFMCFSGEEQGLVGSRRYVEALTNSGDISKVKLMINMDMIGFDPNGTNTARIESNAVHQSLITELSNAAATYAPELNIITSTNPNGGSDHAYFLQAGIPSAFTWENGAGIYPHYHRATDLPENMTGARALAGGILKMNTAVLARRAGIFLDGYLIDGFE